MKLFPEAVSAIACLLSMAPAVLTTGCATILGSTSQELEVTAAAPEAQVRVDGTAGAVDLPATVRLSKRSAHRLVVFAPEHRPATLRVQREVRVLWWVLDAFTLGIGTGVIVNATAHARLWVPGAKQVFPILAWVLFAGVLVARSALGFRGRKSAYMTIAGFALGLMTMLGMTL